MSIISWKKKKRVSYSVVSTLCDCMDCNMPGSSIHGIVQARILAWVAIPFSRGCSSPRDQTHVSCTTDIFFAIWATREALAIIVQSLSHVQFFVTLWAAAHQAFLSFTISWSLLRFMSVESMMLSHPLPLSSFAFNFSQHQGLFQWVGSSSQVAKVLELQLQHQSF